MGRYFRLQQSNSLLAAYFAFKGDASQHWRLFFTTGILGGYTTFSSFGWETAKMLEDGEWLRATTYVASSVVVGLMLSVAGIRLANRF